jgi:hypothetical protein
LAELKPDDADGGELDVSGRVMEMLSEHTLEGWFEGYVLTGRHGFFSSYEAFIHIIDSMFNQHAKWLEKSKKRARLASTRAFDQLSDYISGVAAGSQRIYAPGSGISRRSHQQKSRCRENLLTSGRKLPAQCNGPLPPVTGLR